MLTTSVTSSGQPIVMPQKDVQITRSTYDIAPALDETTLALAGGGIYRRPLPRRHYLALFL
jgi:hypothetical protein